MIVRQLRIGAAVITTDIVSRSLYVTRCSCGWTTRPADRLTVELGVESHARLRHMSNSLQVCNA